MSCDGVRRRVVVAATPSRFAQSSPADVLRRCGSRLELRAAQQAGAAGAALVVADQPEARSSCGTAAEDAEHLAHAGAARAAGEVHQRRAGRAAGAGDAEVDRAGIAPRAIERDGERRAARRRGSRRTAPVAAPRAAFGSEAARRARAAREERPSGPWTATIGGGA